jgi:hypothetical protein
MHGLADFVFREADLCRVFHIERVAGHEKIGGDFLALGKQPQRRKPSGTGDDFKKACAGGFRLQILQQAVCFDAGGKLLDAAQPVGLAHIVGRGNEFRERQILNCHGLTPVG